jgi:hypothetical protein
MAGNLVGRIWDVGGEIKTQHVVPVGAREFCPICGEDELCERPADCPELFEHSSGASEEFKAVA